MSFRFLVFVIFCFSLVSGCSSKVIDAPKSKYAGYDCKQLFDAMAYKVNEANLLYINREDEDSISKFGSGALGTAAGAAMASSLILTPLGWVLAGGLMVAGAGSMVDALDHDELSDSEKSKLHAYETEFNEIRDIAIEKRCDYYSMPVWDISERR